MIRSPQIDSRYAAPTQDMKDFMARFVSFPTMGPRMTLCGQYTPQLGLNMGMDTGAGLVPPVPPYRAFSKGFSLGFS